MASRHESAGRRAVAAPTGSGRSTVWIVAAITLLGAFLRFYRIGSQNYWVDEITTLNAVNLGAGLSWRDLAENIQGPLHAALVWLVSQVSMREAVLRSISAVPSTATIPLVFLLGRRLFDRRAALLAALVFAVLPFSIWYAQELRNYAMLHAFSALSTLLAWDLVERRGRAWAGYVVSTIVSLYLNLSAAFLAFGHNLFAARRLFADRRFLRRWAVAYAVILVCFLPAVWGVARWADTSEVPERIVFAPAADEEALFRGETTFAWSAIPYSVFALSYGYSLGPTLTALHTEPPLEAFLAHAGLVVPAGLTLAAVLLLGLWAAARRPGALTLVLSAVAAVTGGAVLAAIFNVKPFSVRYLSVILPILAVLIGAGLGALPRWPRVALAGAVLTFCGVSLWNYYYTPAYWKEDVRGPSSYIEEHERPGDVVIVPVVLDVFDYYFRGEAPRFGIYLREAESDEQVRKLIDERAGSASRLWFIDARLWGVDPERRIPACLRAHHELVEVREFRGAELLLFRVKGPNGPVEDISAPSS
jgi:4-amino-4-deoxy-L-arabinose transferase-like glycosyltransferase